jgi:hypothetical protein
VPSLNVDEEAAEASRGLAKEHSMTVGQSLISCTDLPRSHHSEDPDQGRTRRGQGTERFVGGRIHDLQKRAG